MKINQFAQKIICFFYLKKILPEVCSLDQFDQHNPHHHKDVYEHTMAVLDATANKLSVSVFVF